MSSKTFKYLVAREESGKDTELAGREANDIFDVTAEAWHLRAPSTNHSDSEFKQAVNIDGDFRVGAAGADKVTMAAASGNLATLGSITAGGLASLNGGIAVSTDKYTVAHTSGDIVSKGTLSQEGGSTFSGIVGIEADLRIGDNQAEHLTVASATGNAAFAGTVELASTLGVDGNFRVGAGDADKLTVAAGSGNLISAGSGTYATSLTAGATKFSVAADGSMLSLNGAGGAAQFSVSDAGAMQVQSIMDIDAGDSKWGIDADGNAEFSGALDAGASLSVETTSSLKGVVSMQDDLQLAHAKAIRFWDSTAVQGEEDAGFIGLDKANTSMILDPSPAGDAGTVIIRGSLQVDGATVTVDSTTVAIEDKLMQLAKGEDSLTNVHGSGIYAGSAALDVSVKYDHNGGTDSHWDISHGLTVDGKLNAGASTLGALAADATVLASAKVTNLSQHRLVYSSDAAGTITDSGNLTFDGDDLGLTGDMAISADLNVGSDKLKVDSTNKIVSMQDVNLKILDEQGVQKALISDAGEMSLESSALVKGRMVIGATDDTVISASGGISMKGALALGGAAYDKFTVSAAGELVAESTAQVKGDLTVGSDDELVIAAASGNATLKGALASYGDGWSISQAGEIIAEAALKVGSDARGNSVAFEVDASGKLVKVAGLASQADIVCNNISLTYGTGQIDGTKLVITDSVLADGQTDMYKYAAQSGSDVYALSLAPFGQDGHRMTVRPGAAFEDTVQVSGELTASSNLSVQSGAFLVTGNGITSSLDMVPQPASGNNPNAKLGSSSESWSELYVGTIHANRENLESIVFAGSVPSGDKAIGQLWFDGTADKLMFKDAEGEWCVGESDVSALHEREVSINYKRSADGTDDNESSSLFLYTHSGENSERDGFVELISEKSMFGQKLEICSGIVIHDQADSMMPSSGRCAKLEDQLGNALQFKEALAMHDIVMIDKDSGGFKKFNAKTKACPFGAAMQQQAQDSDYDGHNEMKDREFGWVNLPAGASLPSFGDVLYYGAEADAGKAVDFDTADGIADGYVIELGEVIQAAEQSGEKKAYVQFCYRYKWKN